VSGVCVGDVEIRDKWRSRTRVSENSWVEGVGEEKKKN